MPRTDVSRNRASEYRWMRWTYGCTAFMGLVAGGVVLFAPEKFARKFVGFPARLPFVEPITFGALGSVWFAFGVISLLGLRAPLRFLPIFLMQLTYKSAWFGAVFFPLWMRDAFPAWGWALAVGNLAWIGMDLKSIPWGVLLAKDEEIPANSSWKVVKTDEDRGVDGVYERSERRAA